MKFILLTALMLNQLQTSSTQSLMAAGQVSMEQQDWAGAIDIYEKALRTGDLNDLGCAVAYWNVYFSHKKLNHENRSMNALLGFIVYGSGIIDMPRYYLSLEKFMMKKKLALAIAEIQAMWASKNNYSCRTPDYACYVKSENFIKTFEGILPFCGNKTNIKGTQVTYHENLIKVSVSCLDHNEIYYFTTKSGF